ncbi:hypothetical protein E8E11_007808 [Didymella keratinophila]|nr:hypothetical protein E8E11_007808 [Didymella keratinophila]
MPRLSKEHNRATASMATPSPARTSGRFHDIFKPRRSTSEGSPKTLTKPPPAVAEFDDVSQGDRESLHTGTEERSGDGEGISASSHHVVATEPVVVHPLGTEAEVESVGAPSSSTPVQGKSLIISLNANRQKLFASNIFDDQDSLSAGIREYVESKIAEALNGHSCACPRIPTNTNILQGGKRIGPYILVHSSNTYNVQKVIVIFYLCIITLAAFFGPKTFFITTWRLAIALTVYFAAGRFLGWQKKAHPDLLLAPVLYATGAMHNILCDAINQYGIFKVYLNSKIMRESLAEVGAVLNPK